MKLQYKTALTMTLFGTVIVALISYGFDALSHKVVLEKELSNRKNIANQISQHLDSHLYEKSAIAMTLSTAPIMKKALIESNSKFSMMGDFVRKKEIEGLNKKWKKINDANHNFILNYTDNPIASFLKKQQIIIPDEYGEIFITNKYGVLVASTGKLTTLAHADKYWWKASYNNGKGKIFLDDRGFDISVDGYVLGVVVPITENDEIIGILKSNVNIMGPLTDVIREFENKQHGTVKIIRTGGLVVLENGMTPLSTHVSDNLIQILETKQHQAQILKQGDKNILVAHSPIKVSMGTEKMGFGGKLLSNDHRNGNQGEGWHIVVSLPEDQARAASHEITVSIILVGGIFTFFTVLVAYFLGRWIAKPIVELATTAAAIGKGRLDERAEVSSRDEIGTLADSLNKMVNNLQKSMTTRDVLFHEVKQRRKAEEKLVFLSTTDELTGTFNRRAFNNHLKACIEQAKNENVPLSILMLDIDFFKRVNDNFGHDIGDIILKEFVRIVIKYIRNKDIMARWGGEEFTILLPNTGTNSAVKLAERIRTFVSEHIFTEVEHLTISIGHTELLFDDDADSFIKRMDEALYKAKNSGRNKVVSL